MSNLLLSNHKTISEIDYPIFSKNLNVNDLLKLYLNSEFYNYIKQYQLRELSITDPQINFLLKLFSELDYTCLADNKIELFSLQYTTVPISIVNDLEIINNNRGINSDIPWLSFIIAIYDVKSVKELIIKIVNNINYTHNITCNINELLHSKISIINYLENVGIKFPPYLTKDGAYDKEVSEVYRELSLTLSAKNNKTLEQELLIILLALEKRHGISILRPTVTFDTPVMVLLSKRSEEYSSLNLDIQNVSIPSLGIFTMYVSNDILYIRTEKNNSNTLKVFDSIKKLSIKHLITSTIDTVIKSDNMKEVIDIFLKENYSIAFSNISIKEELDKFLKIEKEISKKSTSLDTTLNFNSIVQKCIVLPISNIVYNILEENSNKLSLTDIKTFINVISDHYSPSIFYKRISIANFKFKDRLARLLVDTIIDSFITFNNYIKPQNSNNTNYVHIYDLFNIKSKENLLDDLFFSDYTFNPIDNKSDKIDLLFNDIEERNITSGDNSHNSKYYFSIGEGSELTLTKLVNKINNTYYNVLRDEYFFGKLFNDRNANTISKRNLTFGIDTPDKIVKILAEFYTLITISLLTCYKSYCNSLNEEQLNSLGISKDTMNELQRLNNSITMTKNSTIALTKWKINKTTFKNIIDLNLSTLLKHNLLAPIVKSYSSSGVQYKQVIINSKCIMLVEKIK